MLGKTAIEFVQIIRKKNKELDVAGGNFYNCTYSTNIIAIKRMIYKFEKQTKLKVLKKHNRHFVLAYMILTLSHSEKKCKKKNYLFDFQQAQKLSLSC